MKKKSDEDEGEEEEEVDESEETEVENEDAVPNIFPDLDGIWSDLQAHLDGQDVDEINVPLEGVGPANETANLDDEFDLLWQQLVMPDDEELGGVNHEVNWALLSDGDASE